MAIEKCSACERLIDLDIDSEGAYDEQYNYYCFLCIDKNGWDIDEDLNLIQKTIRVE